MRPGEPITPPPGWAPEPHKYKPGTGVAGEAHFSKKEKKYCPFFERVKACFCHTNLQRVELKIIDPKPSIRGKYYPQLIQKFFLK